MCIVIPSLLRLKQVGVFFFFLVIFLVISTIYVNDLSSSVVSESDFQVSSKRKLDFPQ